MEFRPMFAPVRRKRAVFAMFSFATLTAAVVIAGCGGPSLDSTPVSTATPSDVATADANIQAAWMRIDDSDQAVVHTVTSCTNSTSPISNSVRPLLTVDGTAMCVILYVAAGMPAQRTAASAISDSKASSFPINTCGATVAPVAKAASIGPRILFLPKADLQRMAIPVDTGCRIKKSNNTFQSCNSLLSWSFTSAATTTIRINPGFVPHVGDYHHRENVYPPDVAGCRGDPWGYGWGTWQADLFQPAALLMTAALQMPVHGNHEGYTRTSQGWYRFLDPYSYPTVRSCDDPANDTAADAPDPHAVAIGGDTRVIVFDSVKTDTTALATADPWFRTYQRQFSAAGTPTTKLDVMSIFTNHHPILGFVPIADSASLGGSAALLPVMNSLNTMAYYLPGVRAALHDHVYGPQAINFTSNHPATVVADNADDSFGMALPDPFPAINPASGVTVGNISHNSSFGFVVMDHQSTSTEGWLFKAYTVASKLLTTCMQNDTSLMCGKTGFVAS